MTQRLDLGWCQGYCALKYHAEDAYAEKGIIKTCSVAPPFAIFSRNYIQKIRSLDNTTRHDYCFIGSMSSSVSNRSWVIEFARRHFTENSIFINTDNDPRWISLGVFDKTNYLTVPRFLPKAHINSQSREAQVRDISENQFYFETMRQSKFCLCPAGDTSWSFRFYETLMCESIPIVASWHHVYRSREEASIPYKYYLEQAPETHIFDESMVRTNSQLLEEYHILH